MTRRRELADAAERAYDRARRLVFDRIPPGPPERSRLSSEQRAALEDLDVAEAALREHRGEPPGR